MSVLETIVLSIQDDSANGRHPISAEITLAASCHLGGRLTRRSHSLSPTQGSTQVRVTPTSSSGRIQTHAPRSQLPGPSVPDLKMKLPRRVGSQCLLEGSEQLRLAKLKLLGPDGAIDFELEDVTAHSQGSAVGRHLGADGRFPDRTDPLRARHRFEAQIAEHQADDVPDRSRLAFSTLVASAHCASPAGARSR